MIQSSIINQENELDLKLFFVYEDNQKLKFDYSSENSHIKKNDEK